MTDRVDEDVAVLRGDAAKDDDGRGTSAPVLLGPPSGVDREAVRGMSAAECSPLCGAAKAYGRFVKWWQHELDCPAREAAKVLGEEGR